MDEAIDHNVCAVHVPPVKAREMIREGAMICLSKIGQVTPFWVEPPYEMVRLNRRDEEGIVRRAVTCSDDYLELMRQEIEYVEVD